ncbi:hypothetical protein [Nonomuraea turkmeniaca]|uniref:hypothetical protein n=1 Tax=Nonomuraea turkmeniaca TaxID=103838 RepID=UPI001476B076|nr:hypothetical protein [Nonomuraea turkmeniaca]
MCPTPPLAKVFATDREVAVMKACFAEIGGVLTVNRVPSEGTIISGIVPPKAFHRF